MAFSIKTLTLVGLACFLAFPASAQADLDTPLSPLDVLAVPVPTTPVPILDIAGPVDAVDRQLDPVLALAGETLACRSGVAVTAHSWSSAVTDRRAGEATWLSSREVVEWVPIEVTVPRAVPASPATPVDGALAPLPGLDEVQPGLAASTEVLDHVEVRLVRQVREVDVVLEGTWREEYVDWTHTRQDIHLVPAAGAAFLAMGLGRADTVCDPDAPVLSALPSGSCVVCLGAHEDGWRLVDYDVTARMATTDDGEAHGCLCPWAVASLGEERARSLPVAGPAGSSALAPGPVPTAQDDVAAGTPTMWQGWSHALAGQAAAAPAGVAGLLGLAALATALLRRAKA